MVIRVPPRYSDFYPRPLRGGRPQPNELNPPDGVFLSTPSARRATILAKKVFAPQIISIHALCEEGDRKSRWPRPTAKTISIHALCEEGDPGRSGCNGDIKISIHALCEEGDYRLAKSRRLLEKFLSTPSARRATTTRPEAGTPEKISIHALCEEGDGRKGLHRGQGQISIHALCEEGDLKWTRTCTRCGKFLSTPSARRATRPFPQPRIRL